MNIIVSGCLFNSGTTDFGIQQYSSYEELHLYFVFQYLYVTKYIFNKIGNYLVQHVDSEMATPTTHCESTT